MLYPLLFLPLFSVALAYLAFGRLRSGVPNDQTRAMRPSIRSTAYAAQWVRSHSIHRSPLVRVFRAAQWSCVDRASAWKARLLRELIPHVRKIGYGENTSILHFPLFY